MLPKNHVSQITVQSQHHESNILVKFSLITEICQVFSVVQKKNKYVIACGDLTLMSRSKIEMTTQIPTTPIKYVFHKKILFTIFDVN
jgi:hypothetical protein